MLKHAVKMAPEGGDGAGGGGGAAPAAAPGGVSPATPVAPAAPAAPVVPALPEAPKVKVDKLRVRLAKPKAPSGPDLVAVQRELEEVKTEAAATRAALDRSTAALRDRSFGAAFDAAQILPEYRDFAKATLGQIDPDSEAGKKAIDDFAKKHPAMVRRTTPADPTSAWADKMRADDKSKGSLAARMPREVLEATLANMVR